ncbi:TolC family protein [Massilia sp. CCM 9210]|uniref:TolC family protein n=1 Tax=Massilia scottii TaxID=3057166 RepID=UPI002796DA3F|nr:TolC family protein [Massilia sp. CCM 9210]MDQ1812353.1 TolC family protein [Massilia sp. CCM 9210]
MSSTRHHRWVWSALAFSALNGMCVAAPGPAVSLDDALAVARASRAEMRVAAARVDAARQRPIIVSALDDPIIAPSIDHKPVDPMMKTDRSITFEQSFPLSRVRSHRRRAAEADVDRYQGEGGKTALKIDAEVAQAFFMLNERRKVVEILGRQTTLAQELVKLAAARHGVGAATQADVLRMEIEQARLKSRLALTGADLRAAEAMFNTALGQEPYRPVPSLQMQGVLDGIVAIPDLDASLEVALLRRPELRISQAEIRRARARLHAHDRRRLDRERQHACP